MEIFIIYGLVIISLIITFGAQIFVTTSYNKHMKIVNERGITGKDAARYLLDKNGLQDVEVRRTRGFLSDHYDPRNKTVNLSESNYDNATISAVSVACHECGHAIQDKENYIFMRIRAALIPITNFASFSGYIAIVIGCLFGAFNFVWLGIFCEVVILLFQLVTLPVEIDASKRALKELDYAHFFNSKELKAGKTVLTAAALTYVASVTSTLIEILRLVLIFGNNRDD